MCFVYSHDGTNRIINWSKNGIPQTPGSCVGTSNFAWTTLRLGDINTGNSGRFSGYLDNFMIWNKSLTYNEMYQLYSSNLNKFNSTRWYFYVNQSLNATTRLSEGTYSYQTSATNSSGSLNSTILRTINIDSTFPQINFTLPTPVNSSNTTNTSLEINVSILESNLDFITWTWNNTNYTLLQDDISVFYSGNNTNDTMFINSFRASPNSWSKGGISQNLILAMTFNNNSLLGENASSIADLSGNRVNGTSYAHAFYNSSGKFGGAWQFDGTDDYVGTNANILNGTSTFTISLWTQPNGFGSWKGLVGKRVSDTNVIALQSHDKSETLTFTTSVGGLIQKSNSAKILVLYSKFTSSNSLFISDFLRNTKCESSPCLVFKSFVIFLIKTSFSSFTLIHQFQNALKSLAKVLVS